MVMVRVRVRIGVRGWDHLPEYGYGTDKENG